MGIISDTHSYIANIEKSVRLFSERKVDLVIHAGDYVSPEAVMAFNGIERMIGILGNNDVNQEGLDSAFNKINGELRGDLYELEEENMKFIVYHGTLKRKKDTLIQSQNYDVMICGHTHKKEHNRVGKTLVLNPGTAAGWFFGCYATIAIFNTETRQVEFINL